MQVFCFIIVISRNLTNDVRVDLSYALRFGHKPVFFHDTLDWSSYVTQPNSGIQQNIPTDATSPIEKFIRSSLDTRLQSIWDDLRNFSQLAEITHQAGKLLDPSFVNEVLIATMYRLLHLDFSRYTVNELLRLGLLAYATSVFLQDQLASNRYQYIAVELRQLITSLHHQGSTMPCEIRLWLVLVAGMLDPSCTVDQLLMESIASADAAKGSKTWSEVRSTLKAVMWISFIHDQQGQKTAEAAARKIASS